MRNNNIVIQLLMLTQSHAARHLNSKLVLIIRPKNKQMYTFTRLNTIQFGLLLAFTYPYDDSATQFRGYIKLPFEY